ncbi:MAG: hypothetical protein JJ975_00645 [Bacteroidia bacterium]|nr:hypothetical protein [Bacteroidia bacterium]
MRLSQSILILVLLATVSSCNSQTSQHRIEIVPPTIEQEASSIWRTINDITFLEEQGYTIRLPEDPLIDSLIVKSKNGSFGNEDFSAIYTLVETGIFNPIDYQKAMERVNNQIDLIQTLVNEIDSKRSEWDWNFNMFDTYQILFTLYGTGGSYDPDKGTVTLLTNQEGGFMNYENPANTIIHEITHMGLESSIVQRHNLSHGMKERVVDTFVYLMFKDKLPEYKIQNMGNTEIDSYLKTKADLASLNAIVSKFSD